MPKTAGKRSHPAVYSGVQPTLTRRLGWIAPLAGGAAGALAFDPFGLPFLIPLYPLGLFIGMRLAPRPRSAFFRTFLGAFVFNMAAISWLLTLGRFYAIVMGGIVIAALYLSLFPAISAFVLRRWYWRLAPWPHFAAFGAFWIFCEWGRTLGELAVPMVQIGHAWAPWPRLVQIAEFFGEAGLNVQVLLFPAGLLGLLQVVASARGWRFAMDQDSEASPDLLLGDSRSSNRRVWIAGGILGLAVLTVAFSLLRFQMWAGWLDQESDAPSLTVALVQPNIPQEEKVQSVAEPNESRRMALVEAHTRVLEKLVDEEVDADIDLVIFPESAYTDLLFSVFSVNRHRVRNMMHRSGADLLTGGTRAGLNEDMTRIERVWNSAWFIPGDGGAWESYDKIRLVPFGENLSWFRYMPFIGTLVAVGEFERGEVMSVFRTHGIPFSTLICFESYFNAQTRLAVREGAEVLVIITNDGWYGRSAGPYQHHAQSILRAVETRRPLLRSAYTGISSFIDPAGRVRSGLALEQRGVVIDEVRPESEITFFARWGNVWVIGLAVGLALLCLLKAQRSDSIE